MKPPIKEEAMRVFESLLGVDKAHWDAELRNRCGDNIELRDSIERLRDAHEQSSCIIDSIDFQSVSISNRLAVSLTTTPKIIGGFRIVSELGRGAMGVVYRAIQTNPTREVALKLLHPALATRQTRARFESEVELLGRLNHPGIARIYDAGEAEVSGTTVDYLSMELIEGKPLDQFSADSQLSLNQRLQLLVDLCDIVTYAHGRGIIHRDLKPANILVEGCHSSPRIRVLDFGIAKCFHGTDLYSDVTQPGQFLGTISYASPEQIEDPSQLDIRTDVYSLGVIGFELLTSALPIDMRGKSPAAAIASIRTNEPERLRRVNPELSDELEAIFSKTLAKDPSERYPSVIELRADIQRFLSNDPVHAKKRTISYVAMKFARRHRGLVTTLTLFLVVVLLGALGTLYGFLRAQQKLNEQVAMSSSLVSDIVDLQKVAGTSPYRLVTLGKLKVSIESLLAQIPNDVRLRSSHAEVLESISAISLEESRIDEAVALREDALSIRLRLANENPTSASKRSLAKSFILLGDALRAKKNEIEAERLYVDAFDLQLVLLKGEPDKEDHADDLLWSYSRIANIVLIQGRLNDAEAWARDGIEFALGLPLNQQQAISFEHAMLGFEAVVSDIAGQLKDAPRLMELSTNRLKRVRRLLPTEKNNRWLIYHECGALTSAAYAAQQMSDHKLACSLLKEVIEIQKKQLSSEPTNVELRIRVQGNLFAYSVSLRKVGKIKLGYSKILEAVKVGEGFVKPSHPKFRKRAEIIVAASKLSAELFPDAHNHEFKSKAEEELRQYLDANPHCWHGHFLLANILSLDPNRLAETQTEIQLARQFAPAKSKEIQEFMYKLKGQSHLK